MASSYTERKAAKAARIESLYPQLQNYYIQFMVQLADRVQLPGKSGPFAGFGFGKPSQLPTTLEAGHPLRVAMDACMSGLKTLVMTLEDILTDIDGELNTPDTKRKLENLRSYILNNNIVSKSASGASLVTASRRATTRVDVASAIITRLNSIVSPSGNLSECLKLIRINNLMSNTTGEPKLQIRPTLAAITAFVENGGAAPAIPVNMEYIRSRLNAYSTPYDPSAAHNARVRSLAQEVEIRKGQAEALAEVASEELAGAVAEANRRNALVSLAVKGTMGAGTGKSQGGGRRRTHRRRKSRRKSRRHH